MSRVKTFDPDAVLDAATDLFWRRGFADTGIQDLVDELGISRSSLYATFGDKDRLFQMALARYCTTEAGPRHELLTRDGSVRDALRQLLLGLAHAPEQHPDRRGCLIVNAAMERVPGDSATTVAITDQLGRLEEALYSTVRRGQASGEIDRARDARALARFLVCVVQGMRVLGKATADREALLDTVDVALEAVVGVGTAEGGAAEERAAPREDAVRCPRRVDDEPAPS